MSRPDSSQRRERMRPAAPDAEKSLIGCAFLSPENTLSICSRYITPASFSIPAHGIVWSLLCELYEANKPIDPVIITQILRDRKQLEQCGGASAISDFYGTVPSYQNAGHYATIVREKEELRVVIDTLTPIRDSCFDKQEKASEVVEEAEKGLLKIIEVHRGRKREQTIQELCFRSIDILSDPNPEVGITTGFRELDEKTRGMERGELIVVAGGTSDGKSAFVQTIVNHACINDGHRTLIVTGEMSDMEYLWRIKGIRAGFSIHDYLHAREKSPKQTQIIQAVNTRIMKSPLHIRDDLLHIRQIRAEARGLHAKHGKLRLIVLDYDELIRGDREKGENKEIEIASISRHAKEMAKETNSTVILLSQVTEKEDGSRKLRAASAKGNHGNKVWVLNPLFENPDHPKRMTGTELQIRKNRDGERGGSVRLGFQGHCTRFFTPQ